MYTNSLSPIRTGSRRPFSGTARLASVLVRGDRTTLRGSAFRLALLALLTLSFLPVQVAQAATLAVTNTGDSGGGSLRQAILDSNASVGALDTISFNIPGPGPYSIQPLSALPTITDPVIVDGTTQPGFAGAPIVELNGASAGANVNGLRITAGSSTVRGLVINGFSNNGIVLSGSGGNTIAGNYIGTNAAGTGAQGNANDGIFINGSPNNTIGGTTTFERNVVSGNTVYGIQIELAGATNNLVRGNYIGTDKNGGAALGNRTGIYIHNPPSNTVGGTAAGTGNLISGNTQYGLVIASGGANSTVQGNYIGTNANGTADLGNGFDGIRLQNARNVTIGGTTPPARNLIAGNDGGGIVIQFTGSTGNQVQGNYIGTDITGNMRLANADDGVQIVDGSNNTVGGSTGTTPGGPCTGACNLISGNGDGVSADGNGVSIRHSTASGNIVQGNSIGTNAAGNASLANVRDGVWITNSPGNTIGGTSPAARNIISGNGGRGIFIEFSGAVGNLVQGNYIGTDTTGLLNRGNSGTGILIQSAVTNTTIGGTAGAGNTIAFNGGAGVIVNTSTSIGNAIRGNAIFSNGSLGIDLGSDGVTPNDLGDADTGPNNRQNFPVLNVASSRAGGSTSLTDIEGTLNSAPNTNYQVDLFNSSACDPSGLGEGQTPLDTVPVTTDASGNASFVYTSTTSIPQRSFVTASATDLAGNTSEFSGCLIVDQLNETWVSATRMTPSATSDPAIKRAIVSGYLYQTDQPRWYKFAVQPGSRVRVKLTSQPGAIVSLHTDIQKEYDRLNTPQSAAALAIEAAPGAYLPGAYLPGAYLPGAYLPGAYLPGAYLPGAYLPGVYLPGAYLPGAYLPGAYLPGAYLPGAYLPGAYLGAIRTSLMAISADPDAMVQVIDRNTWDLSEDLYVRVSGPADLATPVSLEVTIEGGVCGTVQGASSSLPIISGTQPAAGTAKTLILWDSARMAGTAQEIATLRDKLTAFAARADVAGIVIDLAATASGSPKYPRVAWANDQADQNTACVSAKNDVAEEIRSVIDRYRAANATSGVTTLQYIVLAGGDHDVPFFRYPDVGGLENEKQYVPPVSDDSASQASLRQGQVLGQDAYGAQFEINRGDHHMPVPQLAVGRLVSTAAEVSGQIDAYIATNGMITPHSALVTGYDFVADAATKAQQEFYLGINLLECDQLAQGCTQVDALIQPEDKAPSDPSAWTADQLSQQLLGARHDLVLMAGHFDAANVLAADYSTYLSARAVAESSQDMTNALIFALGCHSGYNIPEVDATPGLSPDPDWPEAFAIKRVGAFVAATGYAYGDTDLTEYGERLFVEISRQIRTSSAPVALGTALADSKQRYLATHAQIGGLDEKTLLEVTLYGLPMLKISMPGQRIISSPPGSIVAGADAVTSGPGAALGLKVGRALSGADPNLIGVTPTITRTNVTLRNAVDNSNVIATYLSGADGVVANPLDPIGPLELRDVSVSGQILRGVGFRGGAYSDDLTGIVPLTSAPTTETSRGHPAFHSDTFYPVQVWNANYFDALDGGTTRLVLSPAQYRSTTPESADGTLRQFDSLDFRLYYLNSNWTSGSQAVKTAAVAAAPNIVQVAAQATSDSKVEFGLHVFGDALAGIQGVWVTYTDPTAASPRWQSIDLVQRSAADPTLWETPSGGVTLAGNLSRIVFMAQAVNGTGLVSLVTNNGAFYTVAPYTPPPPPSTRPTTLAFQSSPAPGAYRRSSSFNVSLNYFDTNNTPHALANQEVTLQIGGLQDRATTDGSGRAAFMLQLNQLPGEYDVEVSFAGADGFDGSSATVPFIINPDSTTLAVSPNTSVSARYGDPLEITATLKDSAGQPIREKSITFVATSSTGTFAQSAITDLDGRATLGATTWPAGSYSLRAYFSGTIPAIGDVTDSLYQPSSANGPALTITGQSQTITFGALANKTFGDPPFIVSATSSSGGPITFSASPIGICRASGTNGSTITIVGAGTCTVVASQVGTARFAGVYVARTFNIARSAQAISFAPLADKTYGDPTFLVSATSGSGLPVTFTAGPASVCSASGADGSTIAIVGVGACNVTANAASSDDSTAAPPVTRSFNVRKANQTISFEPLSGKIYGDAPFSVSAAASSGLPVSFVVGGSDKCMIAGNTVTLTGAGSCTITASQAGNANYNAAAPVAQSFAIDKAEQTISFDTLANKTYGDPSFTASAVGGASGQPVTFGASPTGICSASGTNGSTIAIVGAGGCTMTASQAGNANYSAAADVMQIFTITKAMLTVTANDTVKVLKAPNPAFAASISGFRGGDTAAVVTGSPSCTTTATATSPVGSYPITCAIGTLAAANYSFVFVAGTLRVQYAPAGIACLGAPGRAILQPINADGTSVFRQGSVVPAKFRVCDANGVSIGTSGVVTLFKLIAQSSAPGVIVNEDPVSGTPDTAFRWDTSAQQWIFNIGTGNLSANTKYTYRITLNDGTLIDFSFSLR